MPDLTNVERGDVRCQVDFRDVYASLLGDWLGVDPTLVLDRSDSPVSLFA